MEGPSLDLKRNSTLPFLKDNDGCCIQENDMSFKRAHSLIEETIPISHHKVPKTNQSNVSKSLNFYTPSSPDWKANPQAWAYLQSMSPKYPSNYLIKSNQSSGRKGYLIGRDPCCDVSVHDRTISKRHCLIFMETGANAKSKGIRIFLQDMSSNGTFVNDKLVGMNQRRLLRSGDYIQLKKTDQNKYLSHYQVLFPSSFEANTCTIDYKFREILGRGNFASVYRAEKRKNSELAAIKVINKSRLENKPKLMDYIEHEVTVMMSLEKHPCIVGITKVYNEQTHFFLVLEYVSDGDLFTFVSENRKLNEDQTRFIFWQLFKATQWLHKNKIVHRDIKPENILIKDKTSLHVKISDFGLAKIVPNDKGLESQCGTANYVAPEILYNERSYGCECDMWSLGVVLYICLCGYPPFNDQLHIPMKTQVIEGLYSFPSNSWAHISPTAIELIKGLLTIDSLRRMTCDQAIIHEWMLEKPDEMQKRKSKLGKGVLDTIDELGSDYFDFITQVK